MDDRLDRIIDDREFDEEDARIRASLQMNHQHALHIDKHLIPENMDYMWVRDSLHGEPDKVRMMVQRRKGWTPVPASNHPEMMPEFDHERPSHLDGYIHYSGLILCQRPKRYGEIEREMEKEANFIAMQNIPGQEGSGSDTVPIKVFQHKTDVQRMQSFKDE